MSKVGIMGGTFDPPHIGHLFIAESIADKFSLDKVMFIPTGRVWHKTGIEARSVDRLEMTRLAIEDNPSFELNNIEIKKDEISYTADTLEVLCEDNQNTSFYFIVGADSLSYIDKWKAPEKIFSLCTVVAVGRRGYSQQECKEKIFEIKEKFGAEIKYIEMPLMEVSSSDIRERIKSGKSVRYLVTNKVFEYIKDNKLYLGE